MHQLFLNNLRELMKHFETEVERKIEEYEKEYEKLSTSEKLENKTLPELINLLDNDLISMLFVDLRKHVKVDKDNLDDAIDFIKNFLNGLSLGLYANITINQDSINYENIAKFISNLAKEEYIKLYTNEQLSELFMSFTYLIPKHKVRKAIIDTIEFWIEGGVKYE